MFVELLENLNAEVVTEDDEIEVILLEADELLSYVGSKKNLPMVMACHTFQDSTSCGYASRLAQ